MPEPIIIQALRDHPLRTRDPSQATVFIVPLLVTVSNLAAHCHMWDNRVNTTERCKVHYRRLQATAAAVQKSPYWMAHKGADHALLCHHWQCAWEDWYTWPLHETFKRSIVYYFEGSGTAPTFTEFCRKQQCFPMGRVHLVLPYVDNPHRWEISKLADPFPRIHTVYFSGNFGRMWWYDVRKYMAVLLKEVATHQPPLLDWTLRQYKRKPTVQRSADLMLRAKFCLCPAGDTVTTARMYYSIAAGCIPIIISHSDIFRCLPFLPLLDWRRFALFIDDADFRAGPLQAVQQALEGVSYAAMRRNLAQVQPYLSLLHPQSRVADAVVTELLLLMAQPPSG
eukprot:EG_transcript_7855